MASRLKNVTNKQTSPVAISTYGTTKHEQVSSQNTYSFIQQNLISGIGDVLLLLVTRDSAVNSLFSSIIWSALCLYSARISVDHKRPFPMSDEQLSSPKFLR